MKESLPIEKSQKRHIRVSSTGKPFPAGKGADKIRDFKGTEKPIGVIRDDIEETKEAWKKLESARNKNKLFTVHVYELGGIPAYVQLKGYSKNLLQALDAMNSEITIRFYLQ